MMQVVIMSYLHACTLVPAITYMMLDNWELAVAWIGLLRGLAWCMWYLSTQYPQMRGCHMPQNTHRCRCQCAYVLQSCNTDANNIRGLAHPFEVPRKMAESGSSLCTMTPLRASVVPSLHLFRRWRAARGALSSNTSITRRPGGHMELQ